MLLFDLRRQPDSFVENLEKKVDISGKAGKTTIHAKMGDSKS